MKTLAVLVVVALSAPACSARPSLPHGLADEHWWTLIARVSEPPGPFALSDNLVSNEAGFAERVRWLRPAGGAYIGVGPEQNYSYIAALEPGIAFIVDIRRDNLLLHLLYKALFEVSTDRADFVSRLFSRPRPEGLAPDATVDDLFARFDAVAPTTTAFDVTLRLVGDRLQYTRQLPLTEVELARIAGMLDSFQRTGPDVHFWDTKQVEPAPPSYRALMTATDTSGVHRSFLATEDSFRTVKDLHTRNMIVPVVGDFGGTVALRRIGAYLGEHGVEVQAFYASNVSAYLNSRQAYEFCQNLAALPAAPGASFLESNKMRSFATRLRACSTSD